MNKHHIDNIVRAYFDLKMAIEMNGVEVYGTKKTHEKVVAVINQYPEYAAYYLTPEEQEVTP